MQTLSKLIVITCFVFKAQDKFKPVLFSSFCYLLSLNGGDDDEMTVMMMKMIAERMMMMMMNDGGE